MLESLSSGELIPCVKLVLMSAKLTTGLDIQHVDTRLFYDQMYVDTQ